MTAVGLPGVIMPLTCALTGPTPVVLPVIVTEVVALQPFCPVAVRLYCRAIEAEMVVDVALVDQSSAVADDTPVSRITGESQVSTVVAALMDNDGFALSLPMATVVLATHPAGLATLKV